MKVDALTFAKAPTAARFSPLLFRPSRNFIASKLTTPYHCHSLKPSTRACARIAPTIPSLTPSGASGEIYRKLSRWRSEDGQRTNTFSDTSIMIFAHLCLECHRKLDCQRSVPIKNKMGGAPNANFNLQPHTLLTSRLWMQCILPPLLCSRCSPLLPTAAALDSGSSAPSLKPWLAKDNSSCVLCFKDGTCGGVLLLSRGKVHSHPLDVVFFGSARRWRSISTVFFACCLLLSGSPFRREGKGWYLLIRGVTFAEEINRTGMFYCLEVERQK
jgi:hypothetical protein